MEMKSIYKTLAVTVSFICTFIKAESCEVGVAPPWESITYVPQDSFIRVNCTANGSEESPVWSILLSGSTAISQFSFPESISLLNSRGFYQIMLAELQTGTPKTIQLLINRTEGNNRTLIKCSDVGSSALFSETTLFVYELSPVVVDANIIGLQTINVSWSSQSQSIYTLTIVNSSNTQPQMLQIYQPFYVFTAPEGAALCQFYNFSVTAIYIGATYTGAGCGVPSPVLSTMLPSLPDIGALVSSINISLEKQSVRINLITSFQAARYCEMYPVTNYTMEIEQVSMESDVQSFVSETNRIIASDLLENVIYIFRITAWNAAGYASSDAIIVYTTDVQSVVVKETENAKHKIWCELIPGSDAQGCMIVLVGQLENHTEILRKRSVDSIHTEQLELKYRTVSCYLSVVAFDIESDGSTGTLAVPGHLESSTGGPCVSRENSQAPSTNGSKRVIPHNALIEVVLVISVYINLISILFNGS